jgi:hypothetical protein
VHQHDCGCFDFLAQWYGLKKDIDIVSIVRDILFFNVLLQVALPSSNTLPWKNAMDEQIFFMSKWLNIPGSHPFSPRHNIIAQIFDNSQRRSPRQTGLSSPGLHLYSFPISIQ